MIFRNLLNWNKYFSYIKSLAKMRISFDSLMFPPFFLYFTSSGQVTTINTDKEPPKFSSIGIADKPYQAPLARNSSLEDPCTRNSEYSKAPPVSSEIMTTGTETVKALVSDSRNLRLEKIPESLEKPQVKESSKGIRRLLKFGRKNHSSAPGERNTESDNVTGSEVDDSGTNSVSTSEGSMRLLLPLALC